MRVGVFEQVDLPYSAAFLEGVSRAGDTPIPQNPNVWKDYQAFPLDAAVVFGGQKQDRLIADTYRAIGTPVYVVELGHIKRPGKRGKFEATPNDYFQFGVESINWIPTFDCPNDRREALGITKPRKSQCKDGYVLLVGQKPGDAQHPITDMVGWRYQTERRIADFTSRQIKWRKHPKDLNPADKSCEEPIGEALEGAWCVVTYNSNAGLLALMRGIPVIANEKAFYAPICSRIDKIEKLKTVTKSDFEQLFNRIAYAQWTYEEFRTGDPWRFVKDARERSHSYLQAA